MLMQNTQKIIMGLVKAIIFGCCFLSRVGDSEVIKNMMSILRNELLLGYDYNSRPVKDHNHNTVVYLGISAIYVDVDDHEQTMVFVSHVELMWNDEFLQWNPDDYNNITTLHFDTKDIWSPDIALRNSVKSVSVMPVTSLPVVSNHNGKVSLVLPFTAKVPCELDLTFWPVDKHTCSMQFSSWTHHGELINLRVKDRPGSSSGIRFAHYKINNQWKVLSNSSFNTEVTYDSNLFNFIVFSVTLQRQAAAHATYVTQTTLALMLTVLVSYFLPLRYHLSRLLLHLVSLSILIICNFVLFLSLPSSGGGIPFVVRYFSGTIILTTMSLICNVALMTALCSDGSNSHSQSGIKKRFFTFLGFPNASCSGLRQVVSANEIAYSNLEEELRDMSENTSVVTNHEEPQFTQPSRLPIGPESIINEPIELGFFRLVNVVLFCMFAIAYVVDYIILRSAISL